MCYKLLTFQWQQDKFLVFSFWGPGLVSISMLEQKYVQEISIIYNINKWSYVQEVSKRSFYENEYREMTSIAARNRGWEKN